MTAGNPRRIAALALGLLLAAVAPGRAAPENIILALPTFSLTFSSVYLAQDLGIFAKHGLAVKVVEIAGVGTMNAVIAGSADFAQTSAAALTRGAARGQRLVAIVETIDKPVVQIVLRKELAAAAGFDPTASLAKRVQVLRGRTLAVDAVGSVIDAYVRLVTRRGGLDPEALHLAMMQPSAMLAGFATKQIDGFAMSAPWPQKALLDGDAVMVASGPDGDPADIVPFGNSVVVVRPETCEKRPALCQAVADSYREAVAEMKNHPTAALATLKPRFPTLGGKLLAAAFDVIRKITPDPPVPTKASLENADLYNIGAGLLKPAEKLPSYEGLYTDQFVK